MRLALGLVSTKTREVEEPNRLERRLDEERKLANMVELVRPVWG